MTKLNQDPLRVLSTRLLPGGEVEALMQVSRRDYERLLAPGVRDLRTHYALASDQEHTPSVREQFYALLDQATAATGEDLTPVQEREAHLVSGVLPLMETHPLAEEGEVPEPDARDEELLRLREQVTQVRVAMGKVAVYEGIAEHSPLALMVDELVRDHEELEARIDAVLSLCAVNQDDLGTLVPEEVEALVAEVARLLQGGSRVPDTIEEVEE